MATIFTPTPTIDFPYPESGLVRPVSDKEREAYERDGVAVLRGIIPLDWIDYVRDGVARLMERSDPSSQNYADDDGPRFFAQAFPWLLDDALKAWALRGPSKDIARAVFTGTKSLNFFYDQIFAKEPGMTKATPWHQDFPFAPFRVEDVSQIMRIWVPLDPVPLASGPVHYLLGSHRWGIVYKPIGFREIPEITDTYVTSPYADQPDFEGDYDRYQWLVAEAETGDAVLHHPLTVHGSRGNTTGNFRRAVTSIYTGDRVRWNPHPATFLYNKDLASHVEVPDLPPGGPIDCPLFPRVWPNPEG